MKPILLRALGAATVSTALLACGILSVRAQAPANSTNTSGPKTTEQAFKNIQVLKGIPADQLIPTMQFISASLGVECNFCHVQGAFDKDDKKPKQIARKMIEMELAIDKNNFEGHTEVTCNTCHRGSERPVSIPAIGEEQPKPAAMQARTGEAPNAAAPAAPAQQQNPDQFLTAYLQAVGGEAAVRKTSSRVEKGTATAFGRQFPIEIFSKAPNKRASVMYLPNGESVTVFNGQTGWIAAPGRPPHEISSVEIPGARLDADFYFPANLKQLFSQFRVGRPEKVGDQDATVVYALNQGQPPVKLYFDPQSNLLVRMVYYAETPLGRNPTQIDYSDYRDSAGEKIPYKWTISRPGSQFTVQIAQVQDNAQVEDARFNKPPEPPAPAKPSAP